MSGEQKLAPSGGDATPLRIAIVDDEEPILRALRREFRDQPFEIATYSDPREALAAVRQETFALIISDNRMPPMSGTELLEEVKQVSPETVRIMLTGFADLETAMEAINKGEINYYLTKPWDSAQLLGYVQEGLEKYHLRVASQRLANELRARNASLSDDNAALKHLAVRDRMTGLYNHAEFQEQLTRQVKLFRRDAQPFCLAMGDIDDFKKVNDNYGHPAGDEVIKSVAAIMQAHLREEVDTVCRYGGEEFAIILRNTTLPGALVVMKRILEKIRRHTVETPAGALSVTMSFGAGQYAEGLTEGAWVHDVDKALYRAKRAGKDRVEPVE